MSDATEPGHIAHEQQIVWNDNPEKYEYLREFTVRTRAPTGDIPERVYRRYHVVGYSEVNPDSPHSREYTRRMFVIKSKDKGGEDYDGVTWENKTPAEAVVPESIAAGQTAEKMTP